MQSLLARATHVQYVNVMVPSTIVVVIFVGSLLYNLSSSIAYAAGWMSCLCLGPAAPVYSLYTGAAGPVFAYVQPIYRYRA